VGWCNVGDPRRSVGDTIKRLFIHALEKAMTLLVARITGASE
jgi:hypothetical protein